MKEEKRRIGRPRLADNRLVKESLYMVSLCMVMVVMLVSIGVKSTNTQALAGSIAGNGHCEVNSYKVSTNTIKLVMKCNKKVKSANLAGTKLKKSNSGLYGYRLISIDSNKKIKYGWVSNDNSKTNKTYVINNK